MMSADNDVVERQTLNVVDTINGWSLDDLKARYTRMREDMDAGIAVLREGSPHWMTPADVEHGVQLASAMIRRTSVFHDWEILSESVSILRALLSHPARVSDTQPLYADSVLDWLGTSLSAQYAEKTALETIEESIQLHTQSLDIRRQLHLDAYPSLYGLCRSIWMRCVSSGGLVEDCRTALKYAQDAAQLAGDNRYRQVACQSLVARLLHSTDNHYSLSSGALESVSYGLELLAPTDDVISIGLAAANILSDARLKYTIQPSEDVQSRIIGAIIKLHDLAEYVQHPFRFEPRVVLSKRLSRHLASSLPGCLPQKIADFAHETLEQCPDTSVFYPHCASVYSSTLVWAYYETGEAVYLDTVIALHRSIIPSISAPTPTAGISRRKFDAFVHNHVTSLWIRFEHVGLIEDLDEALEYSTRNLTHASAPSVDDAPKLQLAILLYVTRYQRLHDSADLDHALVLSRNALAVARKDVYVLGSGSMLEAFLLKYREASDTTYLDEAILIARGELAKNTEFEKGVILLELGIALRFLGDHTHDQTKLDEALGVHEEALSIMSTGDVSFPDLLQELALDHASLWRLTGKEEHLQTCNTHYTRAIQQSTSPYEKLTFATSWSTAVTNDNASCSQAFEHALDVLPQIILFGSNLTHRLEILRRTPGIARDAAMHALSRVDTQSALQALERGRAVFWTRLLRFRLADNSSNALGERLIKVQSQIDAELPTDPNLVSRREALTKELDALLQEARSSEGFEYLLRSVPLERLQAAASQGTVVVLVANSSSASAIAITRDAGVIHIQFPNVNSAVVEKFGDTIHGEGQRRNRSRDSVSDERKLVVGKTSRNATYDKLLTNLWTTIAQPIIKALAFEVNEGDHRPRLWWCPTGPFAFLPLHAAGIYEGPNIQCTSDFVVSSYTPTITSLLDARNNPPIRPLLHASSGVLLAAVTDAPGVISLPYASREVTLLRDLVPHAASLGGDGTVERFKDALPSASFLHLACHGKQDPLDPLNSGFVFRDGTLKLSALLDLRIREPCFAFLSACESAMGDKNLPDEAIHLAAAMFFMGYRSVVGTLWAMNDEDGPRVAARVYPDLLKNRERFDYDAVPRALDAAMREMRESGLHPSRWATWIHIGI